MSYELHALRGLWVDTESTFGVAKTFPGSFLAMPFKEGSLEWKMLRKQLKPLLGKILLDGHDVNVLGAKAAELKFAVPLHSHGLDLTGVTAPPTSSTWALMRMLATLLGGSITTTNPGATTVVSSTTTTVTVTGTHGARFQANGCIGCRCVAGSTAIEAREVASVAGDVVTVKQAFSAAPITGQPVNGGVTFHLTEDPATALQFVIEGVETDDRVGIYGAMGGLKIDVPIGGEELPTMTFDLKGATWARLAAQAPQSLAYSVFQAVASVAAELTVPTFGATPRVQVDQSAFTLDLALAYAPITTGGGVENVLRHRRQASRPFAKVGFTTVFQDNTWYTARDAREVRAAYQQVGALGGECVLIAVPRMQIVDAQPAEHASAIAGVMVSAEGRHDSGAVGLGNSVLRLHFL